MQHYSAKIRLAGNVYNEVRKSGLSAGDILLLRREHGSDSVLEIEPSDPPKLEGEVAQMTERERLESVYGEKKVEALFGPRDMPHPIPRYLPELENDAPAQAAKPKRKRRTNAEIEADKKAAEAEIKANELEDIMA